MAYEEYFLCLFILVAGSSRFQGLKRALYNQFLLDNDEYPTTIYQSQNLMGKFKSEVDTAPKGHAVSGDESGVDFAQAQR